MPQTPQRRNLAEWFTELRDWFAMCRIDESGTTHCPHCDSPILHSITVYLSLHVADFPTCAGPGRVLKYPLPWCEHCEKRPEERGCLHAPLAQFPEHALLPGIDFQAKEEN